MKLVACYTADEGLPLFGSFPMLWILWHWLFPVVGNPCHVSRSEQIWRARAGLVAGGAEGKADVSELVIRFTGHLQLASLVVERKEQHLVLQWNRVLCVQEGSAAVRGQKRMNEVWTGIFTTGFSWGLASLEMRLFLVALLESASSRIG